MGISGKKKGIPVKKKTCASAQVGVIKTLMFTHQYLWDS